MTKRRSYKIKHQGEPDVDVLATDAKNALTIRGMDRPWQDGDVVEVSLSKGKVVQRFRRESTGWVKL